eukprot:CAMPEP_0170776606 /NCGR_PEP_ID=MMETSP0733-20121128/11269_1 /TAXON_ID=186038 /ORGANISM="Fragilariopsis kerguelensis, Strain L26-C5" /LENGTH=78 /DNA_ID=CAMNT_0011119617 /DNA_START=563 /DNA_END=800 /DNA_ORIENTATION=+
MLKKVNDSGPGDGVGGIMKQYNEWKNQISKELDIECEVQRRTTCVIDGIVDDNVNTGNRDENGNGDDNDTDVAMDVDE